jgi:hypothetical protein
MLGHTVLVARQVLTSRDVCGEQEAALEHGSVLDDQWDAWPDLDISDPAKWRLPVVSSDPWLVRDALAMGLVVQQPLPVVEAWVVPRAWVVPFAPSARRLRHRRLFFRSYKSD